MFPLSIIVRIFLVLFVGYFISSTMYLNFIYFFNITHNIFLYITFITIGLIISYVYRISILEKFKPKKKKGNKIENN